MEPILAALTFAAAAAASSGLAAVPFALRERPPVRWLGWASALAAGLMLGLAYALLSSGLDGPAVPLALGALLGVAFVGATSRRERSGDSPASGYRLILSSSLHAAHEGVAIGAATAVDWRFGAFMALAVAVHNAPESVVLVGELRERGLRLGEAAALAIMADGSQVVLAVATLALLAPLPALGPWAIGFAAGALVVVTIAEPLPESYRRAGRTSIALVAIAAMGVVVLLSGMLP